MPLFEKTTSGACPHYLTGDSCKKGETCLHRLGREWERQEISDLLQQRIQDWEHLDNAHQALCSLLEEIKKRKTDKSILLL